MSDLISRKAAIELIERMKPYHLEPDDIMEIIDNMPSAQPERKKGEWIKRHVSLYRCSECGRFHPAQENYCPNCGADMRMEATDE